MKAWKLISHHQYSFGYKQISLNENLNIIQKTTTHDKSRTMVQPVLVTSYPKEKNLSTVNIFKVTMSIMLVPANRKNNVVQ